MVFNIDHLTFFVFIFVLGIFVFVNRKKVFVEKIVYPLIYVVMYKTKIGLKFMNDFAKKHKEGLKLLSLIGVGVGFVLMIFVIGSIVMTIFNFLKDPLVNETGMMLVLPGFEVPGIGYLSFWHWILSLFVIVLIHEGSHGTIARVFNIKVKSSGFAIMSLILPVFPAAFVEPDEKDMTKASDVAQYSVLAAGPFSNIILAIIFGLLFVFVMNPISDSFTTSSGFYITGFQNGDFPISNMSINYSVPVTSVNGVDVVDFSGLSKELSKIDPGANVSLGFESGDVVSVSTVDIGGKATLGVFVSNYKSKKSDYTWYNSIFDWLTSLVYWIYMLNIAVGMINLYPIFATDGAQMLRLALTRIYPKRGLRLWVFLNGFFLSLLVVGIVGNYLF